MSCPACVPVLSVYGVLTMLGLVSDKKWLIYSAPVVSLSMFIGYKFLSKNSDDVTQQNLQKANTQTLECDATFQAFSADYLAAQICQADSVSSYYNSSNETKEDVCDLLDMYSASGVCSSFGQ